MKSFVMVDPSLPRHRKIRALTRIMRKSWSPDWTDHDSWSRVVAVWLWAFEDRNNGDVTELFDDDALACVVTSSGSGSEFLRAMESAALIDASGDRRVIHDWHDGGGRIEEKRALAAARQQRARDRKNTSRVTSRVTSRDNHATDADADADAEKKLRADARLSADADEPSGNSGQVSPKPKKSNGRITPSEFETAVMDSYNLHCGDVLTRVRALDSKRRRNIRELAALGHGLSEFEAAFRHAASQSFLRGRNDRKWVADFEFCTRPDKFSKLLEGHRWGTDAASQTRMQLDDGETWGGANG